MTHNPDVTSELSRELSLFQITMMGLGMMIGAGVFLGIGNAIHYAGPGGVLLTFGLNGLLALLTAMAYAELSSAVPRAGGAYNFARLAFGRGPSFVAGWMEWFAASVAGSLYAVTFSIYVIRFCSIAFGFTLSDGALLAAEKTLAGAVAIFFLYINYRGASETGRVGAFITLGQTLLLILIGCIGVFVAIRDPARLRNFDPFLPHGWGRLLVTMGFTYVAFEGYEVIAQTGDEAIEPRRNLPKAMLYSVGVVTVTYVVVAFASIVAVKGVDLPAWQWIGQYREKGFGEAVARLMPAGNLFLTLAVLFASTSALNATIFSATRASYALGRDRMLPSVFARIARRRRTPWVALLFTGVIVLCVAVLLPTRDVASSASIMFLFLFLMVNLCVIRVRRNMGDELTYGFLMPFFPVLPILAVICQSILAVWLVHMSVLAWIVAPLWILAGVALYRLYGRSHAAPSAEEIRVVEETQAQAREGYSIMVAVANPDNALSLVRHTYRLCKAMQARVEMIHMLPVPNPVPLSDAEAHLGGGREAIVETMLYLAPQFPFSSTIRYCRNVARGIISAVRERKTDLLVMGWRRHSRSGRFVLGSTLDPIVERVPCNVVILRNCGDQHFPHVLVPVAGGPNSLFALEVASILAADKTGRVTAFTVNVHGRDPFDAAAFVDAHCAGLALPRDRIAVRAVSAASVTQAILAEAARETDGYDLVVMGCTQDPILRQFVRRSTPETVAQLCPKPFAMVKATRGIESWLKRWV
jgi:basic amino acid/polyamine antiporter, APA family